MTTSDGTASPYVAPAPRRRGTLSIKSLILLMLLAVSIGSVVVVGVIGYVGGSDALREAAYARLIDVRDARAGELTSMLDATQHTLVVAANDQMAIGLIAALGDAGRAVPDDVSVVGFDDVPEAAYVRPALTTVHQDFELVGRRAVESLLAQLTADAPPVAGVIDPDLVIRASTAPPRSR